MKCVTGAVAAATLTLALALPIPSSAQTPAYHVSQTVTLGAPDRWDYVIFDPASHRVYVAHGDRVTVVDGRSGAIVGQVIGFAGGTHGVAIVTAAGRGFTDDGQAGEVGAFNLQTFKVEKRIKAAADADSMAFDSVSGHVFVVDGDSGILTVIDPNGDKAIATVHVGGGLEYAVSGDNGKLYVNGAEKKEIVRIDTRTNRVDARWPVPLCTSPHGLAIDTAAHRLFVSCVNNILTVVNADTGQTVTSVPIGSGTDAAAFDPNRKLIFSSNGRDGTLSIIREQDAQTFVSLGSIKTAPTARTMGIDPQTGRIYLAAAQEQTVTAGTAPAVPGQPPRRAPVVPGSLKLIFLDPP